MSDCIAEFQRIIGLGVIGDFGSADVIEVFGCPKGAGPVNVLTVIVLETEPEPPSVASELLNAGDRIRVPGFPDWTFGVQRSSWPAARVADVLHTYDRERVWKPGLKPVVVGDLAAEPPLFAPADGTIAVPLNAILKNNFWSGSHILVLSDPDKSALAPFFEDARRLQILSEAVAKYIPWKLAGLSNHLGDVIVQAPVASVVGQFEVDRATDAVRISLAWRPGVKPRSVRSVVSTRLDQRLAIRPSEPFTEATDVAVPALDAEYDVAAWDENTGVLIFASAPTSVLNRINLGGMIGRPERRRFRCVDAAGRLRPEEVELVDAMDWSVGEQVRPAVTWLNRRLELEEGRALADRRDFVQYRPAAGNEDERERALTDIRHLINRDGEKGIWLWDPYLTAVDILQTLFWCRFSGAELRGLTDGRDPPGAGGGPSFTVRQQQEFTANAGNCEGIRLEYRTRQGPAGWAFHDRFLIAPYAEGGPRAWSLGTSVNSLGKAHHILQRVSNGALVAGAFNDLWQALNGPEHRIWRCPVRL